MVCIYACAMLITYTHIQYMCLLSVISQEGTGNYDNKTQCWRSGSTPRALDPSTVLLLYNLFIQLKTSVWQVRRFRVFHF